MPIAHVPDPWPIRLPEGHEDFQSLDRGSNPLWAIWQRYKSSMKLSMTISTYRNALRYFFLDFFDRAFVFHAGYVVFFFSGI